MPEAHLVEQSTDDPKLKGSNPVATGTRWKWQKHFVNTRPMATAHLVKQSTNEIKFKGSNTVAADTR